ncbi:MAG: CAP domain-containing protein [Verrucomicrobia bacterium]|nr:CAP domain-containing protein [Verrucomicrobiota bacterium]MBS0636815.1 CAP domain-containing protein [Verrucomicrobiota bacterium]
MKKVIILLMLICSPCLFASQMSDEAILIELVNKERTKKGLKPLKELSEISKVARKHSQNMADKKVSFGHDGFDARFEEVQKIGVRRFGENVAYSYNIKDPLEAAVKGWMKSEGHRENILGDYEETGMGIAYDKKGTFYVTQLFAVRRSK